MVALKMHRPRAAARQGLFVAVLCCACAGGVGSGPSLPGPRAESASLAGVLPRGLRRLTNREFRKMASIVLDDPLSPEFEAGLPPDVRQDDGYARNAAQTMSGALAVKLEQTVPELVQRALERPGSELFTCDSSKDSQPCVQAWATRKFEQAFRRPASAKDVADWMDLYRSGAAWGGARQGAATVLTALLLSPRLWYVQEQGENESTVDPGRLVRLSAFEVADQVALVVRGTLADEALVAAAKAGELDDPVARVAHARRLLALPDTREHYREFVLAWLEADQLGNTSKSEEVFQRYEDFKPRMLAETQAFTDEVFALRGASVKQLLSAGFASVDPSMAVFYGLNAFGPRVDAVAVGRGGVLQQASFLASHSQADTTSPVLRGDFVLRKVLCRRLPRPSELDIEVVMPRPSHEMTRREQFARHSADPRCAQCHDQIDGFGMVFEEFDAAGHRRSEELEKPVRTDGQVTYDGRSYRFGNSRELVRWLTSREETQECFARQMFRFVTGRVDPVAERAFLSLRSGLGAEHRDNVLEHLVAYVASESFLWRRH